MSAISRQPSVSSSSTQPDPGDAISDEPLINAVHRRLVEIALVVYTAFLIYISLVPFDFTRTPSYDSSESVVWGLTVASFPILDVFTNIGLYVPLGALVFAVARRKRRRWITSGILAVLFGSMLSFLLESGQCWVESRVASWVDVTSNVLGCLLGAMLVGLSEGQIRRMLRRARWAARRNWALTLCKASVCIVLLVHLRPYDVVVDVFHTAAAAVRHSDFGPVAGWNGLQAKVATQVEEGRLRAMNELPRVQWEYALDRGVDVAVYAGIAALVILGMAAYFNRRVLLYAWAGFVVVSLAGIVTIMRVFLISHGVDTAHFFCAVIGWPVGCAIGHRMLKAAVHSPPRERGVLAGASAGCPTPSRGGRQTDTMDNQELHLQGANGIDGGRPSLAGLSVRWESIAIGLVLVTAVIYELIPFDFGTGTGAHSPLASDRVCLVPFLAHFHGRPNDALYDISGELLIYGVMGVCLALLLRRRSRWPWRKQLWAVVMATGAVGLVLECLHLCMATRQTDVSTLIIALVGGFAGAVGVRWESDYWASLSVSVVDDVLTRQLIEGETYKKLSAISTQHSAFS